MSKLLEVIARSKAPEILQALKQEKLKFNRIAEIAGNQTTVSRRLEEFKKLELVERRPLEDVQGSVEYCLTDEGEELVPLLSRILELEEEIER